MPRRDRTGPMGMGPMTGRNAGFCAGHESPGYASQTGFGRGMNRGKSFRRMFCNADFPKNACFGRAMENRAYFSETDKKDFLKNQVKLFEDKLANVKKALADFEGNNS